MGIVGLGRYICLVSLLRFGGKGGRDGVGRVIQLDGPEAVFRPADSHLEGQVLVLGDHLVAVAQRHLRQPQHRLTQRRRNLVRRDG